MSNIENLLRRYHEGSLTPEELDELNQLTHRDSVFQSACRQAQAIRRRRYTVVSSVAVVLVAGIVFFAHTSVDNAIVELPAVAQAEVPKLAEVQPNDNNVPLQQRDTQSSVAQTKSSDHHDATPLDPKPQLVTPKSVEQPVNVEAIVELQEASVITDDPIVACNTQCSPDSVINDIWKFLRT